MDEKEVEDLTLLLIYLTSWDENPRREYGNKPILCVEKARFSSSGLVARKEPHHFLKEGEIRAFD